MSFEQIESVWPVHGNILVQDGAASFVAGRSMFIDGGMRLIRLDPATGRILSETVLNELDGASGKNLQEYVDVLNMPAALPDILSSDGEFLYMRTQRFTLDGQRDHVAPSPVTDQDSGKHLFSGAGFLDDTWFHRAYWTYGKSIASGASKWFLAGQNAPSGRIIVLDDDQVLGFGRKPEYYRWSTPLKHQLFASPKTAKIVGLERIPAVATTSRLGEKCQVPATKIEHTWTLEMPLLARAMLLARDTLFVAGPPDILDEEAVFHKPGDAALQQQLEEQEAAFAGQKGALLWAVSANGGAKLAEYKLAAMPVWDGMAAANGALYLSNIDGTVRRMRGGRGGL